MKSLPEKNVKTFVSLFLFKETMAIAQKVAEILMLKRRFGIWF